MELTIIIPTYNEELNFIDNYHYDITLKKLKNSFDEKNIKIFLYEELYKNKSNFSQNISNFLMINSFETKKLLNNSQSRGLHRTPYWANKETLRSTRNQA